MIDRMNVRTTGRTQLAADLSGGNQQKVALAKLLGTEARVFLLDEPTSGIDIAAKSDIHHSVAELARSGAAVLLFSSELPELLSLCSRILAMSKGRITGELASKEATEEQKRRSCVSPSSNGLVRALGRDSRAAPPLGAVSRVRSLLDTMIRQR